MPPAGAVAVQSVLRRSPAPLVWDVDDAVWIGRIGAAQMTRRMCRWSDVAVAGNRLIAEHLDGLGVEVVVIPTCYSPVSTVPDNERSSDPYLLWIGSPATAPLLESYGDTLAQALSAVPALTMEFIGGRPPRALVGHDRVVVTPWSPEAELWGLRRAHFGLAVQPRTPYADHKCGFKIVQYLSAGLLPIASEGPVHRDIVEDVGTLLNGPSDPLLIERLRALPTRSEANRARERWRERYSIERGAEAWLALLRQL